MMDTVLFLLLSIIPLSVVALALVALIHISRHTKKSIELQAKTNALLQQLLQR